MQTNWTQGLCNQKEVGSRLASLLLNVFDPTAAIDHSLLKMPYNNYKHSVPTWANFPGKLKYFHYDIPKLPTYSGNDKHRELVIQNDNELTRIQIDSNGYIFSFSYAGNRDIPLSNLSCLYGKHEKYFNRLVARFDEGIVEDLIT